MEHPLARPGRSLATLRTTLLMLGTLMAGALAHAQAAATAGDPAAASRESFRLCDDRAFLALNIARNYMMTGGNRDTVMPLLRDDPAAAAMAEDILGRIDAGAVRHPGEVAADALFQCAAEQKMSVGAPRERVALCFTRTDVAFFLHVERSKNTVRQDAVSKVRKRLTSRDLYPVALINEVAEAVYAPAKLPDLRQLMGSVAWACINNRRPPTASTASAASR